MASLSSLLSVSLYSGGKNKQTYMSIPQNKRHGVNCVPCRASNGEDYQNSQARGDSVSKFDRRDVLFGLGGLYGLTTLGGNEFALADSSVSPNVVKCERAKIPPVEMDCFPPKMNEIIDFVLPEILPELRVRPAAHLMSPTQIADLERGIQMMKDLDENDPRSFKHQARVHCAYCNHAYKQIGSDKYFQVHFNALFFPFHRAYLYFFERILRDLIGKTDFAIPFWNWDSPCGMYMPQIYTESTSSLYDKNRNARHQPPKLLFLNYGGNIGSGNDVVKTNLQWMYKRMNVKTATEFLGEVIKVGETFVRQDRGSIEMSPHNNIHYWVGDPEANIKGEDMGQFHSSGKDPLFYAHHANVDRMWNIWQNMDNHEDHTDKDWLNSSFVFYDENRNPVRIKVSDCLDSKKLGYVYQDVEIPWWNARPILRPIPWIRTEQFEPPRINFPQILNSDITTLVERPGERMNKTEVLVIEDVEYDPTLPLHFDVLLNVGDEGKDVGPGNIEFVGTFTNIPHGHETHEKASLHFVITKDVYELGLEGDKDLVVKIAPNVNGDRIKIGGIKIQLEDVE